MELLIIVVLLLVTYLSGKHIEKKHYKQILREEEEFQNIMVLEEESIPAWALEWQGEMITGSIVLGADYFRNFVAGFINVFGGRVSVYESLLDRGRREAINRVKKICKAKGHNCLTHLRYETTILSSNRKNAIPQIEVFVYADATTVTL